MFAFRLHHTKFLRAVPAIMHVIVFILFCFRVSISKTDFLGFSPILAANAKMDIVFKEDVNRFHHIRLFHHIRFSHLTQSLPEDRKVVAAHLQAIAIISLYVSMVSAILRMLTLVALVNRLHSVVLDSIALMAPVAPMRRWVKRVASHQVIVTSILLVCGVHARTVIITRAVISVHLILVPTKRVNYLIVPSVCRGTLAFLTMRPRTGDIVV